MRSFCVVDKGNSEERPEEMDDTVVVVDAAFSLEKMTETMVRSLTAWL